MNIIDGHNMVISVIGEVSLCLLLGRLSKTSQCSHKAPVFLFFTCELKIEKIVNKSQGVY